MALAAVGIYGVLAFGVAQRGREFGILQALGADRRAILGLMLRHGLRTASAGIAAGLIGELLRTRLLRSLLFGVSATDPVVYAGVSAVLALVAVAAVAVPSARATRVDPLAALRDS